MLARFRKRLFSRRDVRPAALVGCALGVLTASAAPASAALTFTPPTSFAAHTHPASVAIGDLNGDGKPDLAVADQGSNDASVLLGTGAGSFGTATNFGAHTLPTSVAIGDLNGDGKPDLAVANDGSSDVSVLLGTGSGSFGTATNFGAHTGPSSVAIGDLNGDGKPDLAVANESTSDVSVLLGTGAGSFGTATNFAVHTSPTSVAIGDLNGDGKPDLATANLSTNDATVRLNTTATGSTTPSFATAANFSAHDGPQSVAIGDLNGDGKLDLAVANGSSLFNDVSVLLNTAATGATIPAFAAAANFGAHSNPNSVAIGDLNGDGKLDLAVVNAGSADVSALLNTAATGATIPAFATAANFAANGSPQSVAIGDLNGDGKPDLAVANFTDAVSVLLNAPTADPSPTSLTFGSASAVPQGTVSAPRRVTITNNGSAPLVISGFAVSGTNPDDFFTSDDSCHSAVAPGSSCTVEVRFAPQAQGSRSGTLTVLTNAATNPTVSLAGTAGPLPQGPRGPTGPRGPAGRDAKVTCKVTKSKGTKKVKVTCKVVLVHATASASVRWRLLRHGRTVAHGLAHARNHRVSLRLSDFEQLRPGRYTLRLAGRRRGRTIVIS